MPTTIAENAGKVLEVLYKQPHRAELGGAVLVTETQLSPDQINDAVAILVENNYVEWQRFLGTAPFIFGTVHITPRGRVEYERAVGAALEKFVDTPVAAATDAAPAPPPPAIAAPREPLGSPYGFEDEDWEIVSVRRGAPDRLNVVLGYQFASEYYDTEALARNVEQMFERAIAAYRALPRALPAVLVFRRLSAGYGEHLFNEIARDIISADIAVFELSNLNPNVMLELGVALTWGVRALIVKREDQPRPPSDISGQTWADYRDSAAVFLDPHHEDKMVRMVERAIRKKARP